MLIQAALIKLSGEKEDMKVGDRLVGKNKGVIGSAREQKSAMWGDEYDGNKLYVCVCLYVYEMKQQKQKSKKDMKSSVDSTVLTC